MLSGGAVMRVIAAAIIAATPIFAHAISVNLVGLFPGKAVVVINNGTPRTLSAGQKSPEGVTLISTASDTAVFDIEGTKETLKLGQPFSAPSSGAPGSVTLVADAQGHHWANGIINGRSLRFLVDTGATMVAIPATFAKSAGIDYQKGTRGMVQTANGATVVYKVTLETVQVGGITLHQVNATVMESGLDTPLLGMSFLARTEMKRDTAGMVLTKRF
ncbi:MAG: retroviral-like aspartic protease family protein [Betaproteobacteria bacterium]|nr:retroviral-like aspartic protease family protein [Betaproteobacteria bacterium]